MDVVALGGNAIIPVGGRGTIEGQRELVSVTMNQVADLIVSGRRVVLTHGNGPIVGNIMERNEAVKDRIPPMPLDVCGADSQGGIGYMLQQSLRNELAGRGCRREVVSIVSQVLVSRDNGVFKNPTKPIGPFYTKTAARELERSRGWRMTDDADRGFRRVVPSPRPLEIVEADVIAGLVGMGVVVIAAGGGGIPVVLENGAYIGVEAVIDKDRAAALLAEKVEAERLIILTDVPQVYMNFGKPDQHPLGEVRLPRIKELHGAGEFPPGSMGPKIEAAIEFLELGGREVIISHATQLLEACEGGAGTHIFND
ncbi:MAG: carbamate kinase [bacterium]|nr:MAG: carbamate kinase [bacterium]